MKIIDDFKFILGNDDYRYQKMGAEFEKYVIKMFDKKYFDTVWYNPDTFDKKGEIIVKSNQYPDIIMEYKPTHEKFAIECKFHSKEYLKKANGKIMFATERKRKNYAKFQKENNMPVYVVIGFGDDFPVDEDYPLTNLFCLPLDEAKYDSLFEGFLKKYERPTNKNFFWDTKQKKLN